MFFLFSFVKCAGLSCAPKAVEVRSGARGGGALQSDDEACPLNKTIDLRPHDRGV